MDSPVEKVLITGITGFAGHHLLEYIKTNHIDAEIHGTIFSQGPPVISSEDKKRIFFYPCDIRDKAAITSVLNATKPHKIFHLAAQSYVHSSWENPEATLYTNIIGQSNLLEGVRSQLGSSFSPKIILACSSEEYGPGRPGNQPFDENSELRPQSPYAISKVAQDFMGYQYARSYQMNIVRLRVFNHTGPRRDAVFGVSGFCKKIAQIEKSKIPSEIIIRDLSAVRDFTDVRDVVRAYWLAAEACEAGEAYNVCSGRGFAFKEILEKLLSLSSEKNIQLVPDHGGPRPTDGGSIIGDNSKFVRATGWRPGINFLETTLPDLLNYWREKS
ncbi:MAG: GDP-mannose 4,6-dehydratase [Candidatus Doudnabacteria bacterium]|nr:GDP-mannose 4,6-dehydratase [Candidatus Doudnabacteria bacterium]